MPSIIPPSGTPIMNIQSSMNNNDKLFVIRGRYESGLPWQYILKGCFWSQRLKDASAYTESFAKNIADTFIQLYQDGRYVPTEIEIISTDDLETKNE